MPVVMGTPFNVTANDGATIVAQATFTKIEVSPTCSTAYGTIPKPKGTYIAISMDFATTSTYTTDALGYPTGYDFSAIGPDGYTQAATDVSNGCLADREQFNAPFSASSKYRGWLLIDSPSATGTLIFKPHFSTQLSGWKIAIPS